MAQYYDLRGNVISEAEAHNRYGGFAYKPSARTPRWELTRVQEQEGPAVLKVKTLYSDGTPCRALVICAWPELANVAGYLPSLTEGDAALDCWTPRGIGQFTDPNGGYTGFGLGSDVIRAAEDDDLGLSDDDPQYIRDIVIASAAVTRRDMPDSIQALALSPGAKGAYLAWIFDTTRGSDCITGLGWLGGTEHRGLLDLTFRLGAPEPEPDPEPEPEPGDGDVRELIARLLAAARAFVA